MKTGKVYMVGAGPGDPGLITQKGLQCLVHADIVVYDHLLDERLLDLVPASAEKVYVGKTAGEHASEQSEINELLVRKAREGETVVRLKGGDPFVFGRGGEEAEFLKQNRIPFEVVPGISSAIAVPAYAGIPVTHRRLASSFAVVAGREGQSKGSSSINWENLATGVDTIILLMGMQNLPNIVAKLLEHGRAPDTPVAVIKDGTRPEQITVVGDLTNIVARAKKHHLSAPVVIVVGDVVRLREKLRWFDNRPLFGKRILVTRARHQAYALSQLLSERGALPLELPAIAIQPIVNSTALGRAISGLQKYHWLVFTSVNGVESFFQQLHSLKLDARTLKGIKISAIGSATARALETRGIIADLIPEVYTSKGLLNGLGRRNIAGQRFLLLRADIADKELAEGIRRLGAEVYEVAVYKTVPAADTIAKAKQMILSGDIDVITFTSASTVSNLLAEFDAEELKRSSAKIACIGPKTAEKAGKAGLKVDIVASEQTIAGLVAAIEEYFAKET